jgi:hypothetical protein
MTLVVPAPAQAILPTGYLYLLNYGVRSPSGEYLGMDVLSAAGQRTGGVFLNPAKTGKQNQQWTGIRTVDPLYQKLQNRQTGECVGRTGLLVSCDHESALWRVYTYNRPVTYAFVQVDWNTVLCAAGPAGARFVTSCDTRDDIQPEEQWQTAAA